MDSSSKPPPANPISPFTSKTPEKPPENHTRRSQNRGAALSLEEVLRSDQTRPQHPDEPIKSARKQILSWSRDSSLSKAQGSIKLPQRYEMLAELFDGLDTAIRLLKLRRSMSTFTNISPKIQCLTEWSFTHAHLAQLKYILPEAIEIKRLLRFDERTSCMMPDLHVTLNVAAIEYDENLKSESKYLSLRKIFRARLADFHEEHRKGDEVPEEMLPEPFNSSKSRQTLLEPFKHSRGGLRAKFVNASSLSSQSESSTFGVEGDDFCEETHPEQSTLSFIVEPSIDMVKEQQPVAASQSSSDNVVSSETERTEQNSVRVPFQASNLQVPDACHNNILSNEEASSVSTLSPIKLSLKPTSTRKSLFNCTSKEIETMENMDSCPRKIAAVQSTPAKLASTPARLMAATPALQLPKRCCMSPDDVSTSKPNKLVRISRARSLKFESPADNENVEDVVVNGRADDQQNTTEGALSDDDIPNVLPESLLQLIREKEKKVMEERDPAISQTKRITACLPKLFNAIQFLYQSRGYLKLTKEELIHKIIAGDCHIVDRREVEEQLTLLVKLFPEWISEKLASSGDLLICINKMSNIESIRARLGEATQV